MSRYHSTHSPHHFAILISDWCVSIHVESVLDDSGPPPRSSARNEALTRKRTSRIESTAAVDPSRYLANTRARVIVAFWTRVTEESKGSSPGDIEKGMMRAIRGNRTETPV